MYSLYNVRKNRGIPQISRIFFAVSLTVLGIPFSDIIFKKMMVLEIFAIFIYTEKKLKSSPKKPVVFTEYFYNAFSLTLYLCTIIFRP